VYPGYQDNRPGISFLGKKTWAPGKNLERFITSVFGVPARAHIKIVEAICDAISDAGPRARAAMVQHPAFEDIGNRTLLAWNGGIEGLRGQRVYAMPAWKPDNAFDGFSDPPKIVSPRRVVGRSEELARRASRPKKKKK
jgi:serine/threonine-protein kinase HipA